MNRGWVLRMSYLVLLGVLLLAACQAKAEVTPEATSEAPAEPTATIVAPPAPTRVAGEPALPASYEPLPLPVQRDVLFSGSGACVFCHTNMVDDAGNDVSNDRQWKGTLLANAARDPYWQATVRSEILISPAYQDVIEDKCATCHMPMARTTAAVNGGQGEVLDRGYLDSQNPLHSIAIDGVSCTLCHQVESDNFDGQESFSGGFLVDAQLPAGERMSYGPYEIGKDQVSVMQGVSGFVPRLGPHLEESALCGTCHDLFTPFLDSSGQIAGEFPEQTIYSEWQNSDFAQTSSCQACHMPQAQGAVQISTTGGPRRSPFFQHAFVGGNAFVLDMLGSFGGELGASASRQDFDETIARTVTLIGEQSASVTLLDLDVQDGRLTGVIAVESLVGHKLPGGYPSRRAWLHITVVDGSGQIVFESGAVSSDGLISGNDNDADAGEYEPHYLVLENEGQVQIYESIMLDTDGSVTTTLLRGAIYAKDNRLLPPGFDPAAAGPEIAVYGAAADDPDFLGGGDQLGLDIDLGAAQGPFTVSVELLYQSIGYRWADNLRQYDSLEPARFIDYYEALENLPLLVAQDQVQVAP